MTQEMEPEATLSERKWMVAILRVRFWIFETFRPSGQKATLFWAGLIGFAGAVVAFGFRKASDAVHFFFTQQSGGYVESFSHLAWWQRLLVPAVGGLIAGGILLFASKLRTSKQGGDYLEAITIGDGTIPFRRSVVQSLSALFSIATGASIGREGPLVQLSAMVASLIGRLQKIPAVRLRLYVACGAAAGIASAYNAPIGGALFVSEIILESIAMESFGPLVFASVIATLTTHRLVGSHALYGIHVPSSNAPVGFDLVPYIALGIIAGVVAPLFLSTLRSTKGLFEKMGLPVPLRVALGGLCVGALAIVHPEVCGNGYSTINSVLHGGWAAQALLGVLLFKIVATSISFGSGAVGGVFTPTLFVGACLGFVFEFGLQASWPGVTFQPEAFTLVGMGALLAGTTQAPLMAMILLFEMSLDYDIILPLMTACVVAYYVSRGFSIRSIYAHATESADVSYEHLLEADRVALLMKPNPPTVSALTPFAEVARAFITHRINYLYVAGPDGEFQGAISMHDIKEFLNNTQFSHQIIAYDLLRRDFPTVSAESSLAEALQKFSRHHGDRLPVIADKTKRKLLGSISKNDLLLALVERKS